MTAYERRNLFDRYKQDALFRQWLPTLGVLARAGHGGEVEVWHEVERMLRLLGREPEWREAEVEFLYTELCERYPSAPVFRMAVMAVLFTCLADATPAADRVHENPHAPVCVAICVMMGGERRFHALLDAFFRRTKDNRGRRVVLPVTDYLAGADGGGTVEPEDAPKKAEIGVEPVRVEETVDVEAVKAEETVDVETLRLGEVCGVETLRPEETVDVEMLENLVMNALERDDVNRLNALKLRLYELKRPHVTNPLIARIDERISLLAGGQMVTQNIFHAGANQFYKSSLQSPVIGRTERIEP